MRRAWIDFEDGFGPARGPFRGHEDRIIEQRIEGSAGEEGGWELVRSLSTEF